MRRRGWLLAVAWGLVWPGGSVWAQEIAACPGDVTQNASREQISYASGQNTIRGLIYRPGQPNGAAVVLLHGAGGLRYDALVFDSHAIQLASRGYTVLVPNYYDAQTGSVKRSSRDMRTWRAVAQDGAAFLAAQPGVAAERVALWGYSLGGFLSGEAAMESDSVAAAVSVAGGLDVGEAGRDRRAIPVLLIHARQDQVISPGSTRLWATGLRRRGATVETAMLNWESHGFNHATWCDVFDHTRTFLERAMPAQATSG